jgi:hypothetical protein
VAERRAEADPPEVKSGRPVAPESEPGRPVGPEPEWPAGRQPGLERGGAQPAFYALPRGSWRDWWTVAHPPYTAWHLSYVVIGACLAPTVRWSTLLWTLLAFFLAVGMGAHALDELHGRPLRTAIPVRALWAAVVAGVGGAVVIGALGVTRVGLGLVPFIAAGSVLAVAYNLEVGGRWVHTDVGFAAAWGAFPVLTAYFAEARTLGAPAVVASAAAFALSVAQRRLSTPARALRRKAASVDGRVELADGSVQPLSREALLAPLEAGLEAIAAGMVAVALALALARLAG